jgi:maltose-binding protein MalE
MQSLGKNFEAANPDTELKSVILEEGGLSQRVTIDIAPKGGPFDVMTIGMDETPIWSKKGWLQALTPDAVHDVDDLLPAMGNGLSVEGKRCAAPFYGESSMLMYRKDQADKATSASAQARRCGGTEPLGPLGPPGPHHHSRSLARRRAMDWLCNWQTRDSVTFSTAAISLRFMSCS